MWQPCLCGYGGAGVSGYRGVWKEKERYFWLSWWDLSISPGERTGRERTHSWMACWPGGGGGEQTQRGRRLYSCLGVGGRVERELLRRWFIWGCHNLDGRRSTASSRVPGLQRSLPIGSPLQPPWSQKPPSEPHRKRCARGSDPRSEAAAGAFPRSLTSKGWVSPARPVSPGVFPTPSLPGSCEPPQGKDRRWGGGGSPLARVAGKPREQHRGSAFPGNPLSRRLEERPGGFASRRPARLPGAGSETQLRS